MSISTSVARRGGADRRRRPTGPWDAFRLRGRRRGPRRADERRQPTFADRFPPRERVLAILLLAFSVADAAATLYLLGVGCEEANPAMRLLLARGLAAFLLGKYALTAAGLPMLLIYRNFPLFGTPVRVGHLLPALVGLYGLLLGYQGYLYALS